MNPGNLGPVDPAIEDMREKHRHDMLVEITTTISMFPKTDEYRQIDPRELTKRWESQIWTETKGDLEAYKKKFRQEMVMIDECQVDWEETLVYGTQTGSDAIRERIGKLFPDGVVKATPLDGRRKVKPIKSRKGKARVDLSEFQAPSVDPKQLEKEAEEATAKAREIAMESDPRWKSCRQLHSLIGDLVKELSKTKYPSNVDVARMATEWEEEAWEQTGNEAISLPEYLQAVRDREQILVNMRHYFHGEPGDAEGVETGCDAFRRHCEKYLEPQDEPPVPSVDDPAPTAEGGPAVTVEGADEGDDEDLDLILMQQIADKMLDEQELAGQSQDQASSAGPAVRGEGADEMEMDMNDNMLDDEELAESSGGNQASSVPAEDSFMHDQQSSSFLPGLPNVGTSNRFSFAGPSGSTNPFAGLLLPAPAEGDSSQAIFDNSLGAGTVQQDQTNSLEAITFASSLVMSGCMDVDPAARSNQVPSPSAEVAQSSSSAEVKSFIFNTAGMTFGTIPAEHSAPSQVQTKVDFGVNTADLSFLMRKADALQVDSTISAPTPQAAEESQPESEEAAPKVSNDLVDGMESEGPDSSPAEGIESSGTEAMAEPPKEVASDAGQPSKFDSSKFEFSKITGVKKPVFDPTHWVGGIQGLSFAPPVAERATEEDLISSSLAADESAKGDQVPSPVAANGQAEADVGGTDLGEVLKGEQMVAEEAPTEPTEDQPTVDVTSDVTEDECSASEPALEVSESVPQDNEASKPQEGATIVPADAHIDGAEADVSTSSAVVVVEASGEPATPIMELSPAQMNMILNHISSLHGDLVSRIDALDSKFESTQAPIRGEIASEMSNIKQVVTDFGAISQEDVLSLLAKLPVAVKEKSEQQLPADMADVVPEEGASAEVVNAEVVTEDVPVTEQPEEAVTRRNVPVPERSMEAAGEQVAEAASEQAAEAVVSAPQVPTEGTGIIAIPSVAKREKGETKKKRRSKKRAVPSSGHLDKNTTLSSCILHHQDAWLSANKANSLPPFFAGRANALVKEHEALKKDEPFLTRRLERLVTQWQALTQARSALVVLDNEWSSTSTLARALKAKRKLFRQTERFGQGCQNMANLERGKPWRDEIYALRWEQMAATQVKYNEELLTELTPMLRALREHHQAYRDALERLYYHTPLGLGDQDSLNDMACATLERFNSLLVDYHRGFKLTPPTMSVDIHDGEL